MKRISLVIAIALPLIAAATVAQLRGARQEPTRDTAAEQQERAIDYTNQGLAQARNAASPLKVPSGRIVAAGITSHHLPTAEPFIHDFYAGLAAARPDARRFVVAGPDHFERCKSLVSTTRLNFRSPAGTAANSRAVTEVFLAAGAGEDDACFENEHAIGVQVSFIKRYFPDAEISVMLFSSAATAQMSRLFASVLAERFPDAVVICSTDFSHYQHVDKANRIDAGTGQQIERMDVGTVGMEQVDSPAALRFALQYAEALGARPVQVAHANSYDFTGQPDNTTGYFNVLFAK